MMDENKKEFIASIATIILYISIATLRAAALGRLCWISVPLSIEAAIIGAFRARLSFKKRKDASPKSP